VIDIMPRVLFQNLSDKTTCLGIEPWAEAIDVSPEGSVEIDYDEPAEIVFALLDDCSASVSIVSDRIVVSVDGTSKKLN
jgi:hypothetical protein